MNAFDFHAAVKAVALVLTLLLGMSTGLARGDDAAPPGAEASPGARPGPAAAEMDAALHAARAALQQGPADIKLVDQATLKLPEGYLFVPPAESASLLKAMGNSPSDGLLGMVFPADQQNWFVVVRFDKAGYIKDDEAKDWNADEMLQSIKEGTAEANKERKTRGIAELEIVDWVERPTYDATAHRLLWSIASKEKGADNGRGINYNTYALGRDGYISMNLVTDLNAIEAEKPIAKTLLAALHYDNGKDYDDFNSSTDKIAEYGLAALIGGVAAKKLGLLALLAAFFVKFGKIIALSAVAAAGYFGQRWRKKKSLGA